ncbi:hypothetical protein PAECIP111894_01700 [Paenibacillus pseudetheri]|uniref:Uncharacterized protein n=1 Tax=Paenibacillus pseudetheri TaxID=2897682 RepID=A0ABM9BA04_9BACL|nr:hypothetical protein PAECIP111894_01700 [Paenibacillus pseudetheri]
MDQFFGQLLNMSITGSYVIVFIIVARLFLRKGSQNILLCLMVCGFVPTPVSVLD